MCMYGVLSRFHILHNAWALAIKYWRRLCIVTKNVLLNECFEICTEENHNWLQSIKYILSVIGFRDDWVNPIHICDNFHKIFKQRSIYTRMKSNGLSKRFTALSTLFNRYEMSAYLTAVKNPDIRNTYTRLRIHMNILSTSRNCKNIKDMYPLCDTEPETVSHFILKCPQFSYWRGKFYDNVSSHSPDLKDKNEMTQLKYILDLQCPPDTVRYCCQYIRDIYCFRGKCDK